MKSPAPLRPHAGVTLVEVMVVVVIVGIVLAAAIPSLTGLIERRRVIAVAGEIAGMFTYARSEANVATIGQKLNLHLEAAHADYGSCIRLSTNTASDTCVCGRDSSKVCKGGKSVLVREFTLPPNHSVSFTASAAWADDTLHLVSFQHGVRMTGAGNLAVMVVGSRTGAKLNVEYNDAGRVRICSPDSSVGGFPVCA